MAETGTDYSDTSRWSYHVDDAFYAELAGYVELLDADWPEEEPATLSTAQSFLVREARLIDEGRFNDWLDLFTDDCLYWVPVVPGGGDPTREVSHAFDDRRRLTDRVYWLRTGLAFCQIPQSRTRRLVTNVEVLDDPGTGARLIRSNLMVNEFRAGAAKVYAGWCGHVLVPGDAGWRIRLKQVNLLDSEHGHENLTLVL
jgi:3-phenylpropionate/cinnamic acid dioxygenase small subunit